MEVPDRYNSASIPLGQHTEIMKITFRWGTKAFFNILLKMEEAMQNRLDCSILLAFALYTVEV